MKCFLCNERKAKRYCPAKSRNICAVCCGEKRGIEIDCPEDCKYFVQGQSYQQTKITKQRIKKDGAITYQKRAELYRKNPQLFAKIEFALVDAYNQNSSLLNKDVVGAFELILKTLRSESKGLIYKHRSEDMVVNDLADIIEREVNELKNNPDMQLAVTTGFAKDVIEDFLNEAKFYSDQDTGKNSYLTHLARFHKDRPGGKAAKSEIII
jgi:hypothetical protein